MAFLKHIYICLWISGAAVLPATCEECYAENDQSNDNQVNNVFKGYFYEFSNEPMPWNQAQYACQNRGGQLLGALNCEIKEFLKNLSKEAKTEDHSWWVGHSLMGHYKVHPSKELLNPGSDSATSLENNSNVPIICTYLIMKPFQLVTTSNCSMSLHYLCTLDLNSTQESTTPNTQYSMRKRRNPTSDVSLLLEDMIAQLNNFEGFVEVTDELLQILELNPDAFSYEDMIDFLRLVFKGCKDNTLHLENTDKRNHVINATGGILMALMDNCGQQSPSAQQTEEVFSIFLNIYQVITLAESGNSLANDVFVIELPSATVYSSRKAPENLGHLVVGSKTDGPYFVLPSYSALQAQVGNYENVNVQMYSYNMNPMNSKSNESISGSVCSLSLRDENGTIHLKNLTENIEIFLPQSDAVEPKDVNVSMERGADVISSFNITDPHQTVILIMKPNQNVSLLLLLTQNPTSNITTSNFSTVLTPEEDYRWMVTPEMLGGSNQLWYVKTSLLNSSHWSEGLKLFVSIFSAKCMYWDTDENVWSTNGCVVGPRTTPNMTQCLCNHLTIFGSSFFVMPNHVDLSRTAELFATVSENYVVVVLLSSFFALYFIVLMWAWYADRRALRKRKMTLLEDNHPCAQYNYMLTVQTGHRSGAGTSAKVRVILQGTEGQSDCHHLTDPDKPVFERGGVDVFILTTPFSLGELQSIVVSHDNSGGSPAWYLSRLTIQDLQTRKVWHFLCSTWLCATNSNQMIKRTFNPAKKNEIASFSDIFQTRTFTGFRDEHIWVSVFDPPRRSPFTRVQRVSCCMCLLLCTMAINIMFWNLPIDQSSPVILKIGSFQLTWQEIMVGVESGLLMFPINILIITIFRSIKPKLPPLKEQHEISDYKPPAANMKTILQDTQEMVNLLTRNPKNQVIPLENNLDIYGLPYALERVHGLLHLMQGESDIDPHWVYCSRFVFYCLGHLSLQLEQVGQKDFPSFEEFCHVKNTVALLLKQAEMVSASHVIQSYTPVSEKKKKKSRFWLPWWFVFVGWFLLLSISAISTFFTLLYGFYYGKESSTQWVISLILSLFQSIFVLQPLKVIGVAIFFALILRPVAVEESEEVELLLAGQREKCKLYSGKDIY